MSEPNSKATPIPQSEVTRVKALGFLWDKRTPDRFNGRVITRNGKITAEECRDLRGSPALRQRRGGHDHPPDHGDPGRTV